MVSHNVQYNVQVISIPLTNINGLSFLYILYVCDRWAWLDYILNTEVFGPMQYR